MSKHLVYIDKIGEVGENGHIYRFAFSNTPETTWAEGWNIIPTAIVPELTPSKEELSLVGKVIFPTVMKCASSNTCFSMQDCIDGILPLCFPDLYNNPMKDKDGNLLVFNFGEEYEDVITKLHMANLEITDIEEFENEEDTQEIINNIQNAIDNNE